MMVAGYTGFIMLGRGVKVLGIGNVISGCVGFGCSNKHVTIDRVGIV